MEIIKIEIVRQALIPYKTIGNPILSNEDGKDFEVNIVTDEDIEPEIIIEALNKAKDKLRPPILELSQLYDQTRMVDVEPTINKLIKDGDIK